MDASFSSEFLRSKYAEEQVPDQYEPNNDASHINHLLKPPTTMDIQNAQSEKSYCCQDKKKINHKPSAS